MEVYNPFADEVIPNDDFFEEPPEEEPMPEIPPDIVSQSQKPPEITASDEFDDLEDMQEVV